ncbi:hypothetical protein PMG71_19835 [Roseofilum sp. BLCC_M154]|uniref:Uncharacterized protein n=1 Tax=Roseofilum acuticapitatum BLCC-M154 TaxID=3022444 RepID=A0ABT7AYL5_9CYAN|nr:hypothetical protein [Roseofilum acuticapitatum]MDJ1171682.1 hypothetical protein [Roseofilum acuticapitatum BLCC-M154]
MNVTGDRLKLLQTDETSEKIWAIVKNCEEIFMNLVLDANKT